MVVAVNVGHLWELPGLSCLRRHKLGTCQDAEGSAGRQLRIVHRLAAARIGPGTVPPQKRGPKARLSRTSVLSGQWSVVSGQ